MANPRPPLPEPASGATPDAAPARLAAGSAAASMPTSALPAARSPLTVRIDSRQLFGAAAEVQIDHAGAVYRLKRTALGKLILTK